MHAHTTAHHTGHPGYTTTLTCRPESAAHARALVRAALATWDLEHLTDDAATIASELVANSVTHTGSHAIRVTITRPSTRHIRVAVVDKSKRLPVARSADARDESGRGITVVQALAWRWGTDLLPWGKRVWGELRC
ncbi:ATP-binding protein [Streptomyces sp. AC563]|uniref:ATP-binding protein n=1 Tax=Streptomyces buecherae TaxID=2763006 RepID=UPI00164ED767|nr:ATP-binding protein [Streptomyces buecherae]MBC3988196.1 ATP-binding protein [Streptomyces buecherae]